MSPGLYIAIAIFDFVFITIGKSDFIHNDITISIIHKFDKDICSFKFWGVAPHGKPAKFAIGINFMHGIAEQ